MKLWVLFFVAAVWTLAPTEGRASLNDVKRSASLVMTESRPSYDVKRSANLFSKFQARSEEEEEEEVEAPRKLKPIEFTNAEDLTKEVNNILKANGITMEDIDDFFEERGAELYPALSRDQAKVLLVLDFGGYDIDSFLEELGSSARRSPLHEWPSRGLPSKHRRQLKPIEFTNAEDLMKEVNNILKANGITMEDIDDFIKKEGAGLFPALSSDLAKALIVLGIGGYDIDSYLEDLGSYTRRSPLHEWPSRGLPSIMGSSV